MYHGNRFYRNILNFNAVLNIEDKISNLFIRVPPYRFINSTYRRLSFHYPRLSIIVQITIHIKIWELRQCIKNHTFIRIVDWIPHLLKSHQQTKINIHLFKWRFLELNLTTPVLIMRYFWKIFGVLVKKRNDNAQNTIQNCIQNII